METASSSPGSHERRRCEPWRKKPLVAAGFPGGVLAEPKVALATKLLETIGFRHDAQSLRRIADNSTRLRGFGHACHLFRVERKGIVLSVVFPRTVRHLVFFHKTPVTVVATAEAKVVTNGGRQVDAGTVVFRVAGPGITEDVVSIRGDEGTAIAPLSVAGFFVITNRDP